MKIPFTFLIIALCVAITHATNDFDMDEFERELGMFGGRGGGRGRGFRGGRGRGHGNRPDPTVPITCGTANLCTPRRHRGEVVAENGGVRVCLEHPDRDETKDKCMEMTDTSTGATLVFTGDESQCGCCGGDCPGECEFCPCTDTRHGVTFDGLYMTVTRRRHWWSSSEETSTICVPEGFTEDARLKGGTCFEEGSCPTDV